MRCVACQAPDDTTRHADYLGLCAVCARIIERLVAMPHVQRALGDMADALKCEPIGETR